MNASEKSGDSTLNKQEHEWVNKKFIIDYLQEHRKHHESLAKDHHQDGWVMQISGEKAELLMEVEKALMDGPTVRYIINTRLEQVD